MSNASMQDPQDLTACAVRALVLYSLAELQSGHATTIRVAAEGTSFSISDDGRGHAIQRAVSDTPYLKFIYTHLDYPFESGQSASIQLQGIGMSLINSLCSELAVTVRKREVTLQLSFRDGQLRSSELVEANSEDTGNTVSGTVHPQLQKSGVDLERLEAWLHSITAASPSLQLLFNGRQLQARSQGDA